MHKDSLYKDSFQGDVNKWISPLIKYILSSPEFCLKEGSLKEKLEYVYYFNLGDLKQPAHMVVTQFLNLLEQMEIKIIIQDLKIHLVIGPVYEIAADVAIMSQDIMRMTGPGKESDDADDTDEASNDSEETPADAAAAGEALANADLTEDASEAHIDSPLESAEFSTFTPLRTGEIRVNSPSWCKSRYLLEAVVYHFEAEHITNARVIKSILPRCLKKASEFRPKKIAMDAIGTEYQTVSARIFAKALMEALQLLASELTSLRELVITARSVQHVRMLKKALFDVLQH